MKMTIKEKALSNPQGPSRSLCSCIVKVALCIEDGSERASSVWVSKVQHGAAVISLAPQSGIF